MTLPIAPTPMMAMRANVCSCCDLEYACGTILTQRHKVKAQLKVCLAEGTTRQIFALDVTVSGA